MTGLLVVWVTGAQQPWRSLLDHVLCSLNLMLQAFSRSPVRVRKGFSPKCILKEGGREGMVVSFLWSMRDVHSWRWDTAQGGPGLWGGMDNSFSHAWLSGWFLFTGTRSNWLPFVDWEGIFPHIKLAVTLADFCLSFCNMGHGLLARIIWEYLI